MTTVSEVFVGIDVSKHQLDVAVRPRGERGQSLMRPMRLRRLSNGSRRCPRR